MSLATDAIYRNKFKSKRYTLQRYRCSSSYKVVMYIQKLHHFCNTSSPDDGPKSGRKYLEITNYGRFINQFPPNIIRSIRQFERFNQNKVDKKCLLCSIKYVSMKKCGQNIHIFIHIYIYILRERERDRDRDITEHSDSDKYEQT